MPDWVNEVLTTVGTLLCVMTTTVIIGGIAVIVLSITGVL